MKQNLTSHQHEPITAPAGWTGDARRFALRVADRVGEIYRRLGAQTGEISRAALAAWPVGSIYLSLSDVSPAELFGGQWERLKDRFLLAAGDAHAIGETGGEEKVTLTEKQLPQVKGTITAAAYSNAWGMFSAATGAFSRVENDMPSPVGGSVSSGNQRSRSVEMSFGGGMAHSNMPPWLAVTMWKRTA